MANAAKKITYGPGELELAQVAHAVSVDPTREYLNKPFGQLMQGRGFVCGTDGHRLAAVECEAWQGSKRDNAPPADQVIPWGAKWRGEIVVAGLAPARHFPARWDVKLDVQPKALIARVGVRSGSGKKAADVFPFGRDGVAVDWFRPLEQLPYSFGIQLDYLLDALDFVGAGVVQVWSNESKKHQDLEPLCFTAGAKSVAEAKRIAVVMPFRL